MNVGKQMKYPYSIPGKMALFPWKWYWKNGRAFRYTAYAFLVMYPVFWQIHKLGK